GEQGPRPRPARDDPAPAGHGPRIPHLLPQRPRRTPDRRGGPCGGGDPGVISPGPPSGWRNPITVAVGEEQRGVSAADLLPSRRDLWSGTYRSSVTINPGRKDSLDAGCCDP